MAFDAHEGTYSVSSIHGICFSDEARMRMRGSSIVEREARAPCMGCAGGADAAEDVKHGSVCELFLSAEHCSFSLSLHSVITTIKHLDQEVIMSS